MPSVKQERVPTADLAKNTQASLGEQEGKPPSSFFYLPRVLCAVSFLCIASVSNPACIAPVHWNKKHQGAKRLSTAFLVSKIEGGPPQHHRSLPIWYFVSTEWVGESELEPWQIFFLLPASLR